MQWIRWFLLSMVQAAPMTPDRRGQVRPDRHFDVTQMDLEIALQPRTQTLSGEVTYQLQRLSPGPLVLDQVRLDIQAVTVDGEAVTWWTEGETLRIDLPEASTAVTIIYAAAPRAGVYFRGVGRDTPDAYPEVWTQGQQSDHRHWLPLPDQPDERFLVNLSVEAPAGWSVLTNSGREMPGYLIMFAAAPYKIYPHPEDERLSVWVPPRTPQAAVDRVLDPLVEMRAHFEARTGVPYPWGEYRQVFVQRFLYGGMENTSATVQNLSLLHNDQTARTDGDWTTEVVAHELAHQWYGDLLTCRDWRELWLNEGFAEFFAGDWMATAEGEARWAERIDEWLTRGQSGALAGRFHQGDDPPDNGSVYSKGAAVLQMLKIMLGEERFWAAIRAYTTRHQHRSVITADLQREMEAVSGYNLEWFFQQWVELPYIPELTVRHRFEEGELTVSVAQKVNDDRPRYTLWVEVEVGLEDGSIARRAGWMDDARRVFVIPMETPPRYVAFDPRGGVLASITQEQSPEAWAAQIASPSAYARRVAMRNLGETDQSDALAAALADRERPALERQAAAAALGEQRAETPLTAALKDDDAAVREAVAEALQRGIDPDARAALENAARRDADPNVRSAALKALQRRDPGAALRIAREALVPRTKEAQKFARIAAGVVGEEGRASDLKRLLSPQPEGVWTAHIYAVARLVNNIGDDTARKRARETAARRLEGWLSEGDVRVRSAVVSTLGQLRDPDSLPPLQAARRAETVTWLQNRIDQSVQNIRKRTATPMADNALEARLEALEERLEAAEAELKAMQERR